MHECLATQDIGDLVSSQFGLNAKSRGAHFRDLPIRLVGHARVSLTPDRDLAVPLRPGLSTARALCYDVYGCRGGVVPDPSIQILVPQFESPNRISEPYSSRLLSLDQIRRENVKLISIPQ